jgi:hypothetical protein
MRTFREAQDALPAERLKWETAMRLYGSNATSRRLIQRMLDHVSG